MSQQRIIVLSLSYAGDRFVFSGIDELNVALGEGWQLCEALQGELILAPTGRRCETGEKFTLSGWAIPLRLLRCTPTEET